MPPSSKKSKQPNSSKFLYLFLICAAIAFIHVYYQYSHHGIEKGIFAFFVLMVLTAEQDQKFHEALIEAQKVLNELQSRLHVDTPSGTAAGIDGPKNPAGANPVASHHTGATGSQTPIIPSPDNIIQSSDRTSRADIVIGMAQDTDPKNLVTFCASLRKYYLPTHPPPPAVLPNILHSPHRHSTAEVVLFMNTPFTDISVEISRKYSVRLLPFSLTDLPSPYASYHASTLRWSFLYDFFQVRGGVRVEGRGGGLCGSF